MTWDDFKRTLESRGVTGSTPIGRIDFASMVDTEVDVVFNRDGSVSVTGDG